jgi:hypothetical protein
MTKGIAIIGKSGSRKSLKVTELLMEYVKKEIVLIDGINFTKQAFPFHTCDKYTKAIIIDNIPAPTDIGVFFQLVTGSVIINIKGGISFKHQFEKVILILDEKVTEEQLQGASFIRRFEIVEIIKT